MRSTRSVDPARRRFFTRSGALFVGFSLLPAARIVAQESAASSKLPGSLDRSPMLDAWIRIGSDGSVTVCTGKAELGQGVKTALIALAAEELGVGPDRIGIITADTMRTPDEGYTAGSNSMKDSGTAIQNAAAQVRELLFVQAAVRFGVPVERLRTRDGQVFSDEGHSVGFGELIGSGVTHVRAQARSKLVDPQNYTVIGKSLPRVDIPAKVTGGVAYVHDLRLPGMLHARVVCPPSYSARLRELRSGEIERLAGVVKVVRNGSFVAVVAEREFQAIRAMRALAGAAAWDERPALPDPAHLYDALLRLPSESFVQRDTHESATQAVTTREATYHRPYQMHGAIGPSCAVGWLKDGTLTVWTHSQGVYPLRASLAEMLRLPQARVQCVHAEGSGCYGHNAADDAAAHAALLAMAIPGRPVRVQWMREQEHPWEPYGAAMVTRVSGGVDTDGNIVEWSFDVWSNSHSTRPGGAGNLMPAWLLADPFAQPVPKPIPLPEGGGDRNAIPLYKLPNVRVVHHFIPAMPVRVSALRSLGAYMNVFSIESFVDELARAASADPVAFRLRHLDDPRARDVLEAAAARFGWLAFPAQRGRGRGVAFARYKNLAAYFAVALEVDVEHETGQVRVVRAAAAIDSGQAVNPDGIRNQVEGGIIQSMSWTLHEAVAFDRTRITSYDWSSYPIARFPEIPDRIDVDVIDRPGQPFLGTGEAAQGPTAAAIANAIADATGRRVRDLPFNRERIKLAIGV